MLEFECIYGGGYTNPTYSGEFIRDFSGDYTRKNPQVEFEIPMTEEEIKKLNRGAKVKITIEVVG